MPDQPLTATLILSRAGSSRVGGDRIRLLSAIAEQGSIAAAAREVGLSYKAAWDAVGILNNLFAEPLVIAAPGGRAGGGALVTPLGRALIDGFGQIETAVSRALSSLETGLAGAAHPQGALDVFRSFLMQTSTRNTFRCTVRQVTQGAVNSVVRMRLTEACSLTASITERSAEEMGLEPGTEVYALIKAPFVMLAPGAMCGRVSASNVLTGTISARQDGAVHSELVLDIGGGKSVTSIITRDSAERLALKEGDTATALFKASHVILALP